MMRGGGARMMIHACRRKHHLTSDQPDQILKVLIKRRTVRKGKASLYYTELQMMEQYGYFGSFDNLNNVEFDNVEKHSIIIFHNEDKAIAN